MVNLRRPPYRHVSTRSDPLRRIRFLVGRWFKPVWDAYVGDKITYAEARQRAFEVCNRIRRDWRNGGLGVLPDYSEAKFDEGWQYRVILHEDWDVARDEFANLVFGWW